jgi:hypothetical protein
MTSFLFKIFEATSHTYMKSHQQPHNRHDTPKQKTSSLMKSYETFDSVNVRKFVAMAT